MSQHGKLGAHLALLMPPLAALLYPFLLEAFHANIAPVISGQSAEPALRSAAAALFLLLAFIAPIAALLGAMTLGELAAPSETQRRARTIALLAVAAPPLFVFLGLPRLLRQFKPEGPTRLLLPHSLPIPEICGPGTGWIRL